MDADGEVSDEFLDKLERWLNRKGEINFGGEAKARLTDGLMDWLTENTDHPLQAIALLENVQAYLEVVTGCYLPQEVRQDMRDQIRKVKEGLDPDDSSGKIDYIW
ncbi:MAG: hypothetical protein PHU95_03860 [Candidatus Thermoplasmatota archaeon]|nr:hypothetical protein [Candidatus Thermoplasmatota archaeon]MDD5778564.1 hypothetical protein [Candidatus Thermoplasmatota archaeon]